MLRNILATVGALVAGFSAIALVQAINIRLFPLPEGTDLSDPATAAVVLEQLPVGAYVGLELSYALGSLCAGWVLGRFAARRHTALALGVGGLFTIANVVNLLQIPHPLWLAVLTTATFLPLTLLGRRIAGRKDSPG